MPLVAGGCERPGMAGITLRRAAQTLIPLCSMPPAAGPATMPLTIDPLGRHFKTRREILYGRLPPQRDRCRGL